MSAKCVKPTVLVISAVSIQAHESTAAAATTAGKRLKASNSSPSTSTTTSASRRSATSQPQCRFGMVRIANPGASKYGKFSSIGFSKTRNSTNAVAAATMRQSIRFDVRTSALPISISGDR